MCLKIDKTTTFCYHYFRKIDRWLFMRTVYNTQKDMASGFEEFLKEVFPNIRKNQLKIIPYILHGMIISESLVPSDIAKVLKDDFSLVQIDSVIKRIKRLFTNKHFDAYSFYDQIIKYVISNYKKKHKDKRVHIIFDHMFSRNNYTVFMITMRIGKQGIPLWFRCFEGNECPEAFQEELIKTGISYVSELFNNNFDLIFLADRWFNSTGIMEHINFLGHTYVLRLKKNIKLLHFDKKEGHKIWKFLSDLPKYKYHSIAYSNIEFTDKKYITNIVISDAVDTDDPWILATNGNKNYAIKDYSYRFGGIESVFKNQKSNGFFIENTTNASLDYFKSMYCFASIGILFLTILGADYSKNKRCYRNIKISTHTKSHNSKIRIKSLFKTGLTLFHRAFNSLKYIRISFKFMLYDI